MDQATLKSLVEQVIREVVGGTASAPNPVTAAGTAAPAANVGELRIVEAGDAQRGTDPKEVVIALSPAFSTGIHRTIIGIPHATALKELCAGLEEEGMRYRFVRIYKTADVGFVAHEAAKLSGSGIGVGIQSRGTTVIHQKDLPPLSNVELFSQSPLIDEATFRAIGKNAARYAKGENPEPVPVRNDPSTRPKYQAIAALLHNKETTLCDPSKKPQALQVTIG
ncbi:propanediol/glycerol family dehydratase medium subunit [Georgenia daeguensis]|uniref:Propanediol/glycerol family dehydratase medium subunit n=1 Tax=Georgenia daeguensis TaxID=908355 RepID=A0ABP6UM82_9MICO